MVALVLAGLWGLAFILHTLTVTCDFSTAPIRRDRSSNARSRRKNTTGSGNDYRNRRRRGEAGGCLPARAGRTCQDCRRDCATELKVIALDILLIDKGANEGDDALAKSLAERPASIAAAAVFPDASQSVFAGEDEGLLALTARRREIPSAPKEIRRPCANRHRQRDNRSNRRTLRAIPMLFRTSDRSRCRFRSGCGLRDWKRAYDRAKPSSSRSTNNTHRCRIMPFR